MTCLENKNLYNCKDIPQVDFNIIPNFKESGLQVSKCVSDSIQVH